MKIEQLPHIEIDRIVSTQEELSSWGYSEKHRVLMKRKGYVPSFDANSDSYGIISKVLDNDCVVAYTTDNSQTTFLIKTSRQYASFVCLSQKLISILSSNTTRQITRLYSSDGFTEMIKDEDLIVTDEDKWDKYLKTKLLDRLE